jgi:hypothetical protein
MFQTIGKQQQIPDVRASRPSNQWERKSRRRSFLDVVGVAGTGAGSEDLLIYYA